MDKGLTILGMTESMAKLTYIQRKSSWAPVHGRKINDILALGRYHRPVFDNIKNSDPLLFNSNLFYLPAVSDTLRPQGILVGEPATANLTTSDPGGDNGWITSNVNS